MRTITTTLPALVIAVALLGSTAADEACYTTSTTDDETLIVELPAGLVIGGTATYLVNDFCQDDPKEPDPDPSDPYNNGGGPCLFSVWYYEETNDIPGLQRQDEVHSDVQDCDGDVQGDTIPY